MEEIIYSDDFYVNEFPDKGVDYAKSHVDAFAQKPPKNLLHYLDKQNHFGKESPAFQAAIIGEPRVSLFGKPQAAVLLVHSNFIAYTTTSDSASPVGITYGYATFDNEISVSKKGDHLEMNIPYETFLFGVDSLSKEADHRVVNALLEENAAAITRYFAGLEKQEEAVVQELDEMLAAENQEEPETDEENAALAEQEETIETPVEEPIPDTEEEPTLKTEEVFVPVADEEQESAEESREMPAETENELPVEGEEKPLVTEKEGVPQVTEEAEKKRPVPEVEAPSPTAVEEDENLPIDELEENLEEDLDEGFEIDEYPEQEGAHIMMQKNADGEPEEMKHLQAEQMNQLPAEQKGETPAEVSDNPIDPRFRTEQPIISHNAIPRGFVFFKPVIYADSVRPGLLKTVSPRAGYLKAYQACLDEIKADIEAGEFDAVFNLNFTTQSVENYFDVVVSGDAVLSDE